MDKRTSDILQESAGRLRSAIKDCQKHTSYLFDNMLTPGFDFEAYSTTKAELYGALQACATGLVISVEVYCTSEEESDA